MPGHSAARRGVWRSRRGRRPRSEWGQRYVGVEVAGGAAFAQAALGRRHQCFKLPMNYMAQ